MKIIGKKQIFGIIAVLLLIAGLLAAVYLVQRQQTMESSAAEGEFVNAFEIRDKNGNILTCDSSANPPTCKTGSLDIEVRIKNPDVLSL